MTDDERIEELMTVWTDQFSRGVPVSATDLCRDCTHLVGTVEAAIAVRRQELATGGDASGRYVPIAFHARGGLGEVYRAHDSEIGRDVALKRIRPDRPSSDAVVQRFRREAEVTGRLEHPGVVPIYGLGMAQGTPYYAMRFVEGRTLDDAIKHLRALGAENVLLTERNLIQRFVSVCQTIGYAHSRGVLHRDLKPANVLLGPFGETLVVDWGLAKVLDDPSTESKPLEDLTPVTDETQVGMVAGTIGAMSPEQALGEIGKLGPASDVFSLGAMLYAILTGRFPYHGPDAFENARAGKFDAPRHVDRRVPKALDAICRKAMAFEPKDRYPSALALAADVEHWLADEPVSARPESWTTRWGRWARRHRTSVRVGLLGLILLLVTLAVSAVFLNRARQKAEDNYRLARNAVSDFYDGWLIMINSGGKDTQTLERTFATGVNYYEKFAPDDPLARLRLGQANAMMVAFKQDTGDKAAAKAFAQRADESFQQLLKLGCDDPNAARGALDAGTTLFHLGYAEEGSHILGVARKLADQVPTNSTLPSEIELREAELAYTSGRPADAVKLLQSANDQLAKLPPSTKVQSLSGRVWYYLGLTYGEPPMEDQAKANEALRNALSVRQSVLGAEPNNPDFIHDVGVSEINWAVQLAQTNRQAEMIPVLQTAIQRLEALVRSQPGRRDFAESLARALHNLVIAAEKSGETAKVDEPLRRLIDVRQRLSETRPRNTAERNRWAWSLRKLAERLASTDPSESIALRQQVVALLAQSANDIADDEEIVRMAAQAELDLAKSLSTMGRTADANKAAEAAIQRLQSAQQKWPTATEFKRMLEQARKVEK